VQRVLLLSLLTFTLQLSTIVAIRKFSAGPAMVPFFHIIRLNVSASKYQIVYKTSRFLKGFGSTEGAGYLAAVPRMRCSFDGAFQTITTLQLFTQMFNGGTSTMQRQLLHLCGVAPAYGTCCSDVKR
jgi:hypothetical protein